MKRRVATLAVLFGSLAIAACGSDGGDGSTDRPDKGGADALAIEGVAPIELNAPEGDAVPVFSWGAVDGADSYILSVFNHEGRAYWVWEGSETSVPLGGGERPAEAGSGGPTAGDGFEWMVVAVGADGETIAASAREPVGP